MASAKASEMGVRLQVLLVITSPPVGETVNFLESALQVSGTKTRKTRFETTCFFLFLANPSQEQPARYLIKEGMRATVGFKRPRFIYTKRARVSINFWVNSTIFQQFAARRRLCQPLFSSPL
jgi:hypothetical protein